MGAKEGEQWKEEAFPGYSQEGWDGGWAELQEKAPCRRDLWNHLHREGREPHPLGPLESHSQARRGATELVWLDAIPRGWQPAVSAVTCVEGLCLEKRRDQGWEKQL